jgi:hypothetical protein
MHFVYDFCDGNSFAALRAYQHRYLDRRQTFRRVLERVHCNLRETGTLMVHSHAGCGMSNVWDQDDVLYIVHANPSAGIHHISCSTDGFLRNSLAYRAWEQVLPFHVQPVQGLQQGTNISAYSVFGGCHARLCTTQWRGVRCSFL